MCETLSRGNSKPDEALAQDRSPPIRSDPSGSVLESLSVVVCTYRRPALLRECLDGLYDQTLLPGEIIVVVVRGDEATERLLEEFAARRPSPRTVWQPSRFGLSNARNIGWSAAHGDWIAFIDDDAKADKHWVKALSRGLLPHTSALGGQVRDPDTGRIVIDGVFPYPLGPVHRCPAGCNMVFRKSWLREVGGFDDNLVYGFDDHDIGIKITRTGARLAKVDDAVVWHRRSWGPDHTERGPNLPQYAWSGAYLIARTSRTFGLSSSEHFVALCRLVNELLAIGHPQDEPIGSWIVRRPRETVRTWFQIGQQLLRGTRRGWLTRGPAGPSQFARE